MGIRPRISLDGSKHTPATCWGSSMNLSAQTVLTGSQRSVSTGKRPYVSPLPGQGGHW